VTGKNFKKAGLEVTPLTAKKKKKKTVKSPRGKKKVQSRSQAPIGRKI
jgi:hypothetical protein